MPQPRRAGPFFRGNLDLEGSGSQERTNLERKDLLSSESGIAGGTFLRVVKEHGRPKLEDISAYVRAYSVILNKYFPGRYAVVDGFAGPGFLDLRPYPGLAQRRLEPDPAERELALGSPMLILSNHPNVPVVSLVEKGDDEFAALDERVAAYYPGWPTLYHADANEALPQIAGKLRGQVERALFILDPEGLQVKMETIRRLRRAFSRAEVFLLYPSYMGVARCLNSQRTRPALGAFFGDQLPGSNPPHWEQVEDYYRGGIDDIWPEDEDIPEDVHEALLGLYERRLRESGFKRVRRSPVVRSKRGRPLYHLLFAGDNATAANIIEQVFQSHSHRAVGPKFSHLTLDRFGAYGDHPIA